MNSTRNKTNVLFQRSLEEHMECIFSFANRNTFPNPDTMIYCLDGVLYNHKIVLATISPLLKQLFMEMTCNDPISIIFPDFSVSDVCNQLFVNDSEIVKLLGVNEVSMETMQSKVKVEDVINNQVEAGEDKKPPIENEYVSDDLTEKLVEHFAKDQVPNNDTDSLYSEEYHENNSSYMEKDLIEEFNEVEVEKANENSEDEEESIHQKDHNSGLIRPKNQRSLVWNFFGKDELKSAYSICLICGKEVGSKNGNTYGMERHVKNNHTKAYLACINDILSETWKKENHYELDKATRTYKCIQCQKIVEAYALKEHLHAKHKNIFKHLYPAKKGNEHRVNEENCFGENDMKNYNWDNEKLWERKGLIRIERRSLVWEFFGKQTMRSKFFICLFCNFMTDYELKRKSNSKMFEHIKSSHFNAYLSCIDYMIPNTWKKEDHFVILHENLGIYRCVQCHVEIKNISLKQHLFKKHKSIFYSLKRKAKGKGLENSVNFNILESLVKTAYSEDLNRFHHTNESIIKVLFETNIEEFERGFRFFCKICGKSVGNWMKKHAEKYHGNVLEDIKDHSKILKQYEKTDKNILRCLYCCKEIALDKNELKNHALEPCHPVKLNEEGNNFAVDAQLIMDSVHQNNFKYDGNILEDKDVGSNLILEDEDLFQNNETEKIKYSQSFEESTDSIIIHTENPIEAQMNTDYEKYEETIDENVDNHSHIVNDVSEEDEDTDLKEVIETLDKKVENENKLNNAKEGNANDNLLVCGGRSIVWCFFAKKSVSTDVAFCLHCDWKTNLQGGNTSSMLKHLTQKHNKLYLYTLEEKTRKLWKTEDHYSASFDEVLYRYQCILCFDLVEKDKVWLVEHVFSKHRGRFYSYFGKLFKRNPMQPRNLNTDVQNENMIKNLLETFYYKEKWEKKKKKTSIAWTMFLKEVQDYAMCTYCGKTMRVKCGSTSGLIKHSQFAHKEVFSEIVECLKILEDYQKSTIDSEKLSCVHCENDIDMDKVTLKQHVSDVHSK